MRSNSSAYFLAGLAVLFWGTAATAFKLSLRYTDPITLLLYSTLVSTLAIWGWCLLSGKVRYIKMIGKKELKGSLLLGGLNPFLYYLIIFRAYSLLPAQLAQPLNFIWPVLIVLFSIPIMKEKVGAQKIIALLISFLGVIILSTRGSFKSFQGADPLGIFLALFSSVIWALYWVLNLKNRLDPVLKLGINFLWGSVYILLFFLITGRPLYISLPAFLGASYIGCFEMGITFVVWLQALRLARATAGIANFIYITPFLALLFVALVLKEQIYPSTVTGVILIVSGMILQKSQIRKKSAN